MCSSDLAPAANDSEAIADAARNGHLPVVEYLCGLPEARGVDPAADNNFALREAARCNHPLVVEFLCGLPEARGVKPDSNDNEAIRHAVVNFLRATNPQIRGQAMAMAAWLSSKVAPLDTTPTFTMALHHPTHSEDIFQYLCVMPKVAQSANFGLILVMAAALN